MDKGYNFKDILHNWSHLSLSLMHKYIVCRKFLSGNNVLRKVCLARL